MLAEKSEDLIALLQPPITYVLLYNLLLPSSSMAEY